MQAGSTSSGLAAAVPLLGVLLVAAVLRLHGIGDGDVWVDEANGILSASDPVPVLLDKLGRDSSPPLYYLLLHVWIGIFGDGLVPLRVLSTLFSLGTVALVYAIGARLVSRDAGFYSAFVVAVSPVQIFYSQQVRMYTLLPLLALLCGLFLLRYQRDGRSRDLVLCAGSAAAALYTHNFAFHLGLVLAALLLLTGRLLPRLFGWGIALLGVGLAYAPWVPTFLRQLANRDHYAWFLPLWERYGVLGAAWRTLRSYSPAGEFVMYEYTGEPVWYGAPALLGAALAVLGAIVLWRRRREIGAAAALWLPLLLGLPMVSAIALSAFLTPHYVPGRVDQMMYPAYALLVGVGIAWLRPPAVRVALAVAFLALGVTMKSVYTPDYREHGFDGSDRALAEAAIGALQPGDVVLCTGLTRASLEYALRRAGVDAPILSFPRSTARHLGAQNDWRLVEDLAALRREAKLVVERAREAAGPEGRLLIVRAGLRTNDFFRPKPLERVFGVVEIEPLGRYVQAGTEETVWLSLNELRRPSR